MSLELVYDPLQISLYVNDVTLWDSSLE